MIFKSDKPVYCRSCGNPVSKVTRSVFVFPKNAESDRLSTIARYHYGVLRTKPECQQVIDAFERLPGVRPEKVVSVSKGARDGTIDAFTTWDGVTYKHQYFCTNNCAITMGVAAARTGMCMPPYNLRIKSKPKVGKK